MTDRDFWTEHWVVQTKLQPPALRAELVARPALLARLQQAVHTHRLTLIAAPAGYGKTTLLQQWAAANSAEPRSRGPASCLAWLALDSADNEPLTFVAGLIAALQRIEPMCGRALQPLLPTARPEPAAMRRIIGALVNDIVALLPQPTVLVLDDLHLLDAPPVSAALDALLELLPPQLHLVATTRHAPPLALARLRARGQLAELRVGDLRFSVDEAAALLEGRGLALAAEQLSAVQHHVDGWAAALQLLAGSLQALPPADRARQLQHLLRDNQHIFELLADEVLEQQPAEMRAFLLATSILPDLTPARCRAVTGRPDAALLLETIVRRNLFVTVAAEQPGGEAHYRYHDLFAAFLRRQLEREQPALVAELHIRAARAEPHPARAVEHLLAAEAWEDAARRVEQLAEPSFSQGRLHQLRGWIARVPGPIREQHPWLQYFGGVCSWGLGDFDGAWIWLEQALAGFAARGDERGQGEALVQLSVIAQTNGDFATAQRLSAEALPRPISPRSRAQLRMGLAYLALGAGDLLAAHEHLVAAIDVAEQSADRAPLQIVAMQLRSAFGCVRESVLLFERLRQLIDRRSAPEDTSLHAAHACLEMLLASWRGQLEQADAAAQRAYAISERSGGLSWLMVDVGAFLPRLAWLRGDEQRAQQLFGRFAYLADEYPGWRAALWFYGALAAWDRDEIAVARACYAQMQPAPGTFEWPIGPVLRLIVHGLLASHVGADAEAERLLEEAARLQRAVGLSLGEEPRLVLAYLRLRRDRAAALAEIVDLLELHTRAGTPGLILLHGPRICGPLLRLALDHDRSAPVARALLETLERRATARPVHVAATGETLTAREVEVLRLLGQGARNQAIAEALTVSLPTVKTHVSRVLAKLGVDSRAAAIARARQLGLL